VFKNTLFSSENLHKHFFFNDLIFSAPVFSKIFS